MIMWLVFVVYDSDSFSRSITLRYLLNLDGNGQQNEEEEATHSEDQCDGADEDSNMPCPGSPPSCKLVEYEVEFTTKKLGLKLTDVNGKVVVTAYEGTELELLEGSKSSGWAPPGITGATLVGVNGSNVEQLSFGDVRQALRQAERPLRIRFRETIYPMATPVPSAINALHQLSILRSILPHQQ